MGQAAMKLAEMIKKEMSQSGTPGRRATARCEFNGTATYNRVNLISVYCGIVTLPFVCSVSGQHNLIGTLDRCTSL